MTLTLKSAPCASGEEIGHVTDLFGVLQSPPRCRFCQKPLKDPRPNRRYCSNVCRAAASRERRELERERAAEARKNRFLEFHQSNPHIFSRLLEVARKAKDSGHRPGMKAIVEWVRFGMDDISGRGLQINNSFVSLYAELVEKVIGEGFFEHRHI